MEINGIGDFGEKKTVARGRKECPCKPCKKHAEGCHGGCEPYNEWLIDERTRNQEIREIKEYHNESVEYDRKRRKWWKEK